MTPEPLAVLTPITPLSPAPSRAPRPYPVPANFCAPPGPVKLLIPGVWLVSAPPLFSTSSAGLALLCVRITAPTLPVDSPRSPYPFLVYDKMPCACVPVFVLVTFNDWLLPDVVNFVVDFAVFVDLPTISELPSAASARPCEPRTAPPSNTAPPVNNARRDREPDSADSAERDASVITCSPVRLSDVAQLRHAA